MASYCEGKRGSALEFPAMADSLAGRDGEAGGGGESEGNAGGKEEEQETAERVGGEVAEDGASPPLRAATVGMTNVVDETTAHLYKDRELQTPENTFVSSAHTPMRRPWSPCPSDSYENTNKKSALPCVFYLKGWCIKGKKCGFLHQSEGATDCSFEDKKCSYQGVRTGDLQSDIASMSETMLKTSSDELSPSSAIVFSSKLQSQFDMQRKLVRAYGGHGTRTSPTAADDYCDRNISIRRCASNDSTENLPQGSSISNGLYRDIGASYFKDKMVDERPWTSKVFTGRKYLNEVEKQEHVPRMHDSTSLSSEYVDSYNITNHDGQKYCSRSGSPPKSSSQDCLISERHDYPINAVSWDLPGASWRTTNSADAWEPSVPFQSAFCPVLPLSSSGNQYDPPLDSLDPSKTGNTNCQLPLKPSPDISSHLANDDHLTGIPSQVCNMQKLVDHKSVYGGNASGRVGGLASQVEAGINIEYGRNALVIEEKALYHDSTVYGTNVYSTDVVDNPKDEVDQERISKESRVVRIFHAALVDFLKELIKPSWKEAHLSKDDHKVIIKKAVEKVIGTLPRHQVPNNTEAIKQYLSFSRTKLLKLVEGYVEKYSKDRSLVS